ncbi:MAG: S-layer homology domain-containing protein [Candidatus Margulisiibacteriota bacterium]
MVSAILIVTAFSAAAAEQFKDMPAKHWAADSVYNLVKLGVVDGYPDGTFRGSKNVTRYEAAVLLSKLANAIGADTLKDDIAKLKQDVLALKESPDMVISGQAEMMSGMANLTATEGITEKGPVSQYRVITTLNKKLGKNARVAVTMDTMDAGYYGGANLGFPMDFIDVVGDITLDPYELGFSILGFKDPVQVLMTAGPGDRQHTDATGFIPSENNVTFFRPDTGFSVGTKMFGLDVAGAYSVIDHQTDGKVNTNLLKGILDHTFTAVPLIEILEMQLEGSYYMKNPHSGGPSDKMARINLAAPFGEKVKAKAQFGMGKYDRAGWMVGGELQIADAWNTGTSFMVKGAKVGSEYISTVLASEQNEEAGFDVFMRPLQNAQVDIGGEVSQILTDRLVLKGKGDIKLSPDFQYGKDFNNTNITAQVGISYDLAPATNFDAFYRLYQDPTASETTDLAAAGLIYRF